MVQSTLRYWKILLEKTNNSPFHSQSKNIHFRSFRLNLSVFFTFSVLNTSVIYQLRKYSDLLLFLIESEIIIDLIFIFLINDL